MSIVSAEKSKMERNMKVVAGQNNYGKRPLLKEREASFLGRTQDGEIVIDRPNSHLHEEAKFVIEDAISRINTRGKQFIEEEVDFGGIIGNTSCVFTDKNDEIVYAQRPNRSGLTRFVVGREPEPTSKIFVVLKKMNERNKYVLITAFLGSRAQPEPWDKNATAKSFQFWRNRALIWGSTDIQEGTATNICPWE